LIYQWSSPKFHPMIAYSYLRMSFILIKNFFLKVLDILLVPFKSELTWVFIDDSFNNDAGLATLTSIFIPQRKMESITIDFYKILSQIIDKFPKKNAHSRIIYSAPVLHGDSLLKNGKKENSTLDFSNIDDDFRIKIFNDIIDLVIKHKLRIVRLGYNNYDELSKMNFKQNQMDNLNWIGLSTYIDRSLKIKKAVCVMEGNNDKMIHALSAWLSSAKETSYLYPDLEKSSAFKNSKKFIGNVFYVNARYCEYLQIADVIGYILHKKDYIDITGNRSDFSKRIYELQPRLEKNIESNELNRLSINGA